MDEFRTLILTAAVTPLAQQIATTLSPAAAGMWTTPLSPTGQAPDTHYISTGYIGAEFAHMVPSQTWEQDADGQWVMTASTPGDPQAVTDACVALGMTLTIEQVEQVFAGADVTAQDPFTAMARLGLQMVAEDARIDINSASL